MIPCNELKINKLIIKNDNNITVEDNVVDDISEKKNNKIINKAEISELIEYRNETIDKSKLTCPTCGAVGQFNWHGHYIRYCVIVIYIAMHMMGNVLPTVKIVMFRVKCTSCEHTHTLIPKDINPYCIYTLKVVLLLLTTYYIDNLNVKKIAEKYNMCHQNVCRFIKIFDEYYQRSMVFFKDIQVFCTSKKECIEEIHKYNKEGNFAYDYYLNNKHFFMMSRKDMVCNYLPKFSNTLKKDSS